MTETILENLRVVIFTAGSCVGFAMVFRVERKNIFLAGLGGLITGIVFQILKATVEMLFLRYLLSAMAASLYSELMAMKAKTPSTVFLYPSIIPLLPGSTLYYIAMSLILEDSTNLKAYVWKCILTVSGMCLGFVLSSTFRYYGRLYSMGAGMKRRLGALINRGKE